MGADNFKDFLADKLLKTPPSEFRGVRLEACQIDELDNVALLEEVANNIKKAFHTDPKLRNF